MGPGSSCPGAATSPLSTIRVSASQRISLRSSSSRLGQGGQMPWRLGRDGAQPITKVNTTVSISTRNKTNINMTHDIKPPHTCTLYRVNWKLLCKHHRGSVLLLSMQRGPGVRRGRGGWEKYPRPGQGLIVY